MKRAGDVFFGMYPLDELFYSKSCTLNVYIYGSRIYGPTITTISMVLEIPSCQKACIANSECQVWSLNIKMGSCHLKSTSSDGCIKSPGWVSGPKYCGINEEGELQLYEMPDKICINSPNSTTTTTTTTTSTTTTTTTVDLSGNIRMFIDVLHRHEYYIKIRGCLSRVLDQTNNFQNMYVVVVLEN